LFDHRFGLERRYELRRTIGIPWIMGSHVLSSNLASMAGGNDEHLCTSAGDHRLEQSATRRLLRLMFLKVRTLPEPAAEGASLDFRRDEICRT
jgi:hypothetical protein